MALENGNPDKKRSFLCTTGRRASFLDRDRTSRGIFPKQEFKNVLRDFPEGRKTKNHLSGFSRKEN